MPTNNSINTPKPIDVSSGGTGLSTATTAYGVIAAGTTATGAFQNIGTGSAGEVLKSNGAGVLPSFQAASAPSLTCGFHVSLVTGGQATFVNPVPFDTVIFDIGGDYSLGTSLFTAPATGYYFFSAQVFYNNNSLQAAVIAIVTTGRSIEALPVISNGASGANTANVSGLFFMTAGDTAKVTAGINAVGTTLFGGSINNFFCGYKVG